MTHRFRPTDAFVDESIRGQRYLMGCVLVEARSLTDVRDCALAQVLGRTRLHFHQEIDSTRRRALAAFAELPIRVVGVVCVRGHGVTEFQARGACLGALVTDLQRRSVERLVIESRQDDRDDQRTIGRVRLREPRLVFEHRRGVDDPLLWVSDAVTWALGAGREWYDTIRPLVDQMIELRP